MLDHRPTIPLWDGAAGPRAAEAIEAFLDRRLSASALAQPSP
jgi:hypothetical protein